ncbi:hypothetical protein EUGRSUZ_C00761 [Eucalyptus grandis]|uniref:Uncharacterized protein n=2 Tax=Eucalyptus grandis TaxID=71139 RepID=A0ACC3LBD8_EUCGR|nr:hypothetical protein EUGRSUZ_C00761 [Eucalyptus grandis]
MGKGSFFNLESSLLEKSQGDPSFPCPFHQSILLDISFLSPFRCYALRNKVENKHSSRSLCLPCIESTTQMNKLYSNNSKS